MVTGTRFSLEWGAEAGPASTVSDSKRHRISRALPTACANTRERRAERPAGSSEHTGLRGVSSWRPLRYTKPPGLRASDQTVVGTAPLSCARAPQCVTCQWLHSQEGGGRAHDCATSKALLPGTCMLT